MLDYMAGQSPHLNRTVLDAKKPRVPVYPPLETGDVMVVPQDTVYHHQRPISPSLNTSFADLMLGDRPLLHTGREGRLGRCVEAREHLYDGGTRTTEPTATATITNLRDTIIALQLQNTELSLCLQQERRRREEAETGMEREREYIKRLEENIQSLKNSRLIINPNMYRQIAESYIASRKTPVRRTCSSNIRSHGKYEDLVCDSPHNEDTASSNSAIASATTIYPRDPSLRRAEYLQSTSHVSTSSEQHSTSHSSINLPTLLPRLQPILPISERQDLLWPPVTEELSGPGNSYLLGPASNSPPLQKSLHQLPRIL